MLGFKVRTISATGSEIGLRYAALKTQLISDGWRPNILAEGAPALCDIEMKLTPDPSVCPAEPFTALQSGRARHRNLRQQRRCRWQQTETRSDPMNRSSRELTQ